MAGRGAITCAAAAHSVEGRAAQVLVTGAAGRTGRLAFEQAAACPEINARAVVRWGETQPRELMFRVLTSHLGQHDMQPAAFLASASPTPARPAAPQDRGEQGCPLRCQWRGLRGALPSRLLSHAPVTDAACPHAVAQRADVRCRRRTSPRVPAPSPTR